MLRLRFLPGLILGLLVGLPVGIGIGVLALAPHGTEQSAGTSSLVQDLTHKLEAAKEERDRADHQLEQFQKLADQMTSSFNNLEMRFKLLEEEQRVRDAQLQTSQAAIPARAPAPPPPAPTATAPVQASAPQTPAVQPPDGTETAPGSGTATQTDPKNPEAQAPADQE